MASIVWPPGRVPLPGAPPLVRYPARPYPPAGVHSPITASCRSRGRPVAPARKLCPISRCQAICPQAIPKLSRRQAI